MSLIAHYHFYNNANDNINLNNGLVTGLTFTEKPNSYRFSGKVAVFDNSNAKISFSNNKFNNSVFTIECWFHKTQTCRNFTFFSNHYIDNNNSRKGTKVFIGSNGEMNLDCDHGAIGSNCRLTYALAIPASWHHLVASYITSNAIIYLDGKEIASSNLFIDPTFCADCVSEISHVETETMKLADFRIYDHALTAVEVAAHYEAEKPLEAQCQFRPDDTRKWTKRFGNDIVDVNITAASGDKTLSELVEINGSGSNCISLTGGGNQGEKLDVEVDDGLYLIHQSRSSDVGSYEQNWELNRVENGEWQQELTRDYVTDSGVNKAQVVKALVCSNLTIESGRTLSVDAWDGNKGGVGVIVVKNTLTVNGSLLANGKGFAGGAGGPDYNGYCGESATGVNILSSNGENNGAGGGGGHGHNHADYANSCGGGAGHATVGTAGSKAYNTVTGYYDVGAGGIGGAVLGQADLKKLYLGAGGGGGAAYPHGVWDRGGRGGNGGGALLILAKKIVITGNVQANGDNGNIGVHAERAGTGGGGAGGSIVMICREALLGTALVTASGGSGVSNAYIGSGAGGTGRIAVAYGKNLTGTTNPTALTGQNELYRDNLDGDTLAKQVR